MSSPWLTKGTTSLTPAARRSRSAGESSWSPSSATGPGALIRYMTSGSLGAMSTRGVSAVRCEGRAMEWSVARADEAVGSDPRPRTQRSDRAKLSISTSFYGPGVRKALPGSPLRPEGRVAERDPDAEVEVVPALSPAGHELTNALAHGHRHADRPRGRVRARHGIVEEREDRVAGEALERRLVLEHQRAERVVVFTE